VTVILGVPYDGGSSGEPGARHAPDAFRAITSEYPHIEDAGDIELVHGMSVDEVVEQVRRHTAELLDKDYPIVLGGDDSISYGFVAGAHDKLDDCCLLHFDAHPDVLDHDGRLNHSTWVRRLIEDGLVERVASVGVRPWSYFDDERQWAVEHGVQYMQHAAQAIRFFNRRRYVVVIDVDVLDPIYMAGTGRPVPGGLSLEALCNQLMVTDPWAVAITEFAPGLDSSMVSMIHGLHLLRSVFTLFDRDVPE
jgi:agmatinase